MADNNRILGQRSRVRRSPCRRLFRIALLVYAGASCGGDGSVTDEAPEAPRLIASASSVALSLTQGQAEPVRQSVLLEASQAGVHGLVTAVSYGSGQPGGWLTASLGSASAPSTLVLEAGAGSLAPGVYEAMVRVTAQSVRSTSIQVILTVVAAAPRMALSADTVRITATVGGAQPAPRQVNVNNAGTGTLTGIGADVAYGSGAPGWLTATLSGTTAPVVLTVSANTAGRAAGVYEATVNVRSQTFPGAAASLAVVLTVTQPPPPPPPAFPLSVGKRWRYLLTDTSTVGPDRWITIGTMVLQVITPGTLEGRSAWHLEGYELGDPLAARSTLNTITFFVSSDASGLSVYTGGSWRRALSTVQSSLPGGTLFLAGTPLHQPNIALGASTVSVPYGTSSSTRAVHSYREGFTQYAPYDIDEQRTEHFVAGVGSAYARIDYLYEDNVSTAGLIRKRRTLRLTHVDTGPFPEVVSDAPGATSAATAQPLGAFGIARGTVARGDPGAVLTDAGVGCTQVCIHPDRTGVKRIQDWYRITLAAPTNLRIDTDFPQPIPSSSAPDLDLYLFRQSGSGIVFVGSSTGEAGVLEYLRGSLPAGTYFLGVQAFDTPTGAVQYWLSARSY